MIDKSAIQSCLRVYFVAGTQDFCHRGEKRSAHLLATLEEALSAGITCYQFRDKGAYSLADQPQAQQKLAKECLALCRQYGVPLIVNDDVALARAIDADGIHVGQTDLAVDAVRKQCPQMILGLSVNTLAQAVLYNQVQWIDYFGVGPIFATNSKKNHQRPVGLAFIRSLRENGVDKPLVAIGSVKAAHVATLRQYGADGVAVISAISQADDVARAVAELRGE